MSPLLSPLLSPLPSTTNLSTPNPAATSLPETALPTTISELSSIPVLLERADRHPEQPWVFFRPKLDWRWYSWGEMAAALGQHLRSLEALPAGCRVAWKPAVEPESVALGLAIEASGRWAIALPPDSGKGSPTELPPGCGIFVTFAGEEPPPGLEESLSIHEVPRALRKPGVVSKPSPFADGSLLPETLAPGSCGGAESLHAHGAYERISLEEAERAVRESFGELGPARKRDIFVAGPPAWAEGFRQLLVGSIFLGAALVLEPEAAAWPATLRWVRPTLLVGSPSEIRRGRQALGAPRLRRSWWPWGKKSRPRSPWDRLRGVILLGEEALQPEEFAFWHQQGVKVAPALGSKIRQP